MKLSRGGRLVACRSCQQLGDAEGVSIAHNCLGVAHQKLAEQVIIENLRTDAYTVHSDPHTVHSTP
eukprot:2817796-Pyramimonas_sp.AAC.1